MLILMVWFVRTVNVRAIMGFLRFKFFVLYGIVLKLDNLGFQLLSQHRESQRVYLTIFRLSIYLKVFACNNDIIM